ncbi:hypothetical protein BmR1_04g05131 [Babesia microti strain RI]|uniref:Uncharacterized protein n=1 Tax=Babesia microti (strain RI) TaxID=1133968 RepID=A0A1N6LXB8_BABMR|nr:hypothetical protein BmR1_04g05131 [Babesia microti strain RI]SIO73514.1 hypothetical protein BmR1_04g05131 [Babesia microti strain RI]|eukprot:XP_021337608.1 hypothetical protein BmR1_04g05131 [Babesia microti strain RI]
MAGMINFTSANVIIVWVRYSVTGIIRCANGDNCLIRTIYLIQPDEHLCRIAFLNIYSSNAHRHRHSRMCPNCIIMSVYYLLAKLFNRYTFTCSSYT